MLLKDKVVLITGASQGIGASIALHFAAKGAKVLITYRTNKDGADKVISKIKNKGAECAAFKIELTNEKEVEKLFKDIANKFPNLDILVNNTGKSEPKSIQDTKLKDWEKAFGDNLFSTVLCTKEALKIMERQKHGKIINISSINGLNHVSRPGDIAYSAAKAWL